MTLAPKMAMPSMTCTKCSLEKSGKSYSISAASALLKPIECMFISASELLYIQKKTIFTSDKAYEVVTELQDLAKNMRYC
jgi:hypothetical protein